MANYSLDQLESDISQIVAELATLRRAKGRDYSGTDDTFANLREYGSLGVVIRMADKMHRLQTLYKPGAGSPAVADESVDDTVDDMINYALFLRILRAQEALLE